jgi:hypothetical protein
MSRYVLAICIVAGLSTSAFGVEKTVYKVVHSPYGIENTIAKIVSGSKGKLTAMKELTRHDAELMADDIDAAIKTLKVWVNGEEVDVKVLTASVDLLNQFLEWQREKDWITFLDLLPKIEKVRATIEEATKINNLLMGFLEDTGPKEGTIEYRYSFWYQIPGQRNKVYITRYTKIQDNYLYLYTHLDGNMMMLTSASLAITARESEDETTTIRADLTAATNLGNRCCLVRRAVNRRMPGMMCQQLNNIERKARSLAEAGTADPWQAMRSFIDIVPKQGMR